jgi:glucose-6-phosphate 1-dehydrogenase
MMAFTFRSESSPPGLTADLSKVAMRFSYEAALGKSSANGYERLLLDARCFAAASAL